MFQCTKRTRVFFDIFWSLAFTVSAAVKLYYMIVRENYIVGFNSKFIFDCIIVIVFVFAGWNRIRKIIIDCNNDKDNMESTNK